MGDGGFSRGVGGRCSEIAGQLGAIVRGHGASLGLRGGRVKLLKSKRPLLPTPAESRLLQALWALKEATVEQIVGSFPLSEQPNYKTTHTFLRIMESKGFVEHAVSGKAFVFKPVVSEYEVARASVNTLLKQSFGGSVNGLLMNLLESDTLKGDDLRQMESLIRKYRKSKEEETSR